MSGSAWAHGFVGERFFPTTLAIEDPFAQDELTFNLNHIKEPAEGNEPAALSTELEAEFAKRITPTFALSLGSAYVHRDPDGEPVKDGFGNLEIAGKWQFFTSATHETVLSVGFGADVGDTGDTDAEANDFTTLSPSFFFGKGFGDLPDTVRYLRPLAVTGLLTGNFPTRVKTVNGNDVIRHATTLDWGVAILYDLHYLQTRVQDIGLSTPFNHIVPVIELAFNSCLNRDCDGKTTGNINPGFVWFGKHLQLGLEAQLPVNDRTGNNIGLRFQVHFFTDDLLPNSLGKPLFDID